MAHLWIEQDQEWGILPLGADRLALTGDPAQLVRIAEEQEGRQIPALLQRASAAGSEWTLLCRPGDCHINGEPVALGIRVLRDKDEIRIAHAPRFFFSAETQARITPFAGAAKAAICPRCLLEIALGQPAVLCPGCGIAYHEDGDAELACWTYGPCLLCGQPGALDAGFRWTPTEL